MLEQLEEFAQIINQQQRDQLCNRAADLLIDQVLFLALMNEIEWKRVNKEELNAEVSISIPGREPIPTLVIFYWTRDNGGDHGLEGAGPITYYLHVGNKKGPCLNSANNDIALLAQRLFINATANTRLTA